MSEQSLWLDELRCSDTRMVMWSELKWNKLYDLLQLSREEALRKCQVCSYAESSSSAVTARELYLQTWAEVETILKREGKGELDKVAEFSFGTRPELSLGFFRSNLQLVSGEGNTNDVHSARQYIIEAYDGLYRLLSTIRMVLEGKQQNACNELAKRGITKYGHYNILESVMRKRDEDTVKLLLMSGILGDDGYFDALFASMREGSADALWFLSISGILDVNECDSQGRALIHRAVAAQYSHDYLRMLLAIPDIDVNLTDVEGKSPLHIAVERNLIFAAQLLLERPDIDVNQKNNRGWTPLYHAVYLRETEMVQVLLNHPNIDVNCSDDSGITVLLFGIHWRRRNEVELLLHARGIDVNQADHEGWFPAYMSVFVQDAVILRELLVMPGIELDRQCGESGLSFLEYAETIDSRYAEMIRLAMAYNKIAEEL